VLIEECTSSAAAFFLRQQLGKKGYDILQNLPPRAPSADIKKRWPDALHYRALSIVPAARLRRWIGQRETVVLVVMRDDLCAVVTKTHWLPRWLPARPALRPTAHYPEPLVVGGPDLRRASYSFGQKR
jgi:hypothetical protein